MTSIERFIVNLTRSKTDEQRCDAACQLKSYITGDLQDEGTEKYNKFIDELNHKIVDLSNSGDAADKKAAVLTIGEFLLFITIAISFIMCCGYCHSINCHCKYWAPKYCTAIVTAVVITAVVTTVIVITMLVTVVITKLVSS